MSVNANNVIRITPSRMHVGRTLTNSQMQGIQERGENTAGGPFSAANGSAYPKQAREVRAAAVPSIVAKVRRASHEPIYASPQQPGERTRSHAAR